MPTKLKVAQIAVDIPVGGWTDTSSVVHQIEVLNANSLDAAMGNIPLTKARVQNQVNAIYVKYGDGTPIYLDFEPGALGWARADVRALAIELASKYVNVWIFPGAIFDSLVQANPAAAVAVAASASNGILFPAYHGTLNVSQHLSTIKTRLNHLATAGIKFGVTLSRVYNDAVQDQYKHTTVPLADFVSGAELCRGFTATLIVWLWDAPWDDRKESELSLAVAVGDSSIVVGSVAKATADIAALDQTNKNLLALGQVGAAELAATKADLVATEATLATAQADLAHASGDLIALQGKYDAVWVYTDGIVVATANPPPK